MTNALGDRHESQKRLLLQLPHGPSAAGSVLVALACPGAPELSIVRLNKQDTLTGSNALVPGPFPGYYTEELSSRIVIVASISEGPVCIDASHRGQGMWAIGRDLVLAAAARLAIQEADSSGRSVMHWPESGRWSEAAAVPASLILKRVAFTGPGAVAPVRPAGVTHCWRLPLSRNQPRTGARLSCCLRRSLAL